MPLPLTCQVSVEAMPLRDSCPALAHHEGHVLPIQLVGLAGAAGPGAAGAACGGSGAAAGNPVQT